MIKLPDKLIHGDNLQNLFEKFNRAIDYLREIRLVAGDGIRLSQHINGVKIESTATGNGGVVSGGSQGHPFDAKIINTGTEENPQYAVRIFNSALPDSPYAGFVYVGDWDIPVEVENLSLLTNDGFFVVLTVEYDRNQNPPFPVSLSIVPYGSGADIYPDENVFREIIAEGKLPDVASTMTGDVLVTGRYI